MPPDNFLDDAEQEISRFIDWQRDKWALTTQQTIDVLTNITDTLIVKQIITEEIPQCPQF